MPANPKSELILPDLTPEQERAITARYLAEMAVDPPELLPPELFYPIMKLLPSTTVEVAYVRPSEEDENVPEVLLTQRPPDDPVWPNEWHFNGSIVRSKDEITHEHDWQEAIDRNFEETGGGLEIISPPKFYDVVHRATRRGPETSLRFMSRVEGTSKNGDFFNAVGAIHKPPKPGLLPTYDVAIAKVAMIYPKLGALPGLPELPPGFLDGLAVKL